MKSRERTYEFDSSLIGLTSILLVVLSPWNQIQANTCYSIAASTCQYQYPVNGALGFTGDSYQISFRPQDTGSLDFTCPVTNIYTKDPFESSDSDGWGELIVFGNAGEAGLISSGLHYVDFNGELGTVVDLYSGDEYADPSNPNLYRALIPEHSFSFKERAYFARFTLERATLFDLVSIKSISLCATPAKQSCTLQVSGSDLVIADMPLANANKFEATIQWTANLSDADPAGNSHLYKEEAGTRNKIEVKFFNVLEDGVEEELPSYINENSNTFLVNVANDQERIDISSADRGASDIKLESINFFNSAQGAIEYLIPASTVSAWTFFEENEIVVASRAVPEAPFSLPITSIDSLTCSYE